MNVAGAILTGGASRRMGRTKAIIEVDGRAMADRAADALRAAGVSNIACIGGDHEQLGALSAPVVADAYPGQGPVGGVLTALEHFNSADHVVVVACDMPFLTADVITAVINPDATTLVAVAHTGRIEPTCAMWSRRALVPVRAAFDAGERALHRVIDSIDHRIVAVDPDAVTNMNTPEDLRQ